LINDQGMDERLLPAPAAAHRIGVKRDTLYAYVSRGRLTVHRRAGHRGSWFDPVELDALVRRAREPAERRPEIRITSAITLIEHGHYWYRGRAPEDLVATKSFETVAELLWTGSDDLNPRRWSVNDEALGPARAAQNVLPRTVPASDRLRVIVAVLGALDSLRYDIRPEGATATARRLLATTVAALPGRHGGTVSEQVLAWLGPRRAAKSTVGAINTALIVMADHELAASTLAVRVAASFRADPYAAVSAGLGAIAGAWHGAASGHVERLLTEVGQGRAARDCLGRALRAGGLVSGFGQPLYPDGDPRTPILLNLARTFGPLCGPLREFCTRCATA
jgi:citrate synthase